MEGFDHRILYALENNLALRLTLWKDGFTEEVIGPIHYVDPITHELHIEVKDSELEKVAFKSVVRVYLDD